MKMEYNVSVLVNTDYRKLARLYQHHYHHHHCEYHQHSTALEHQLMFRCG